VLCLDRLQLEHHTSQLRNAVLKPIRKARGVILEGAPIDEEEEQAVAEDEARRRAEDFDEVRGQAGGDGGAGWCNVCVMVRVAGCGSMLPWCVCAVGAAGCHACVACVVLAAVKLSLLPLIGHPRHVHTFT
jgi:hypothetical protein